MKKEMPHNYILSSSKNPIRHTAFSILGLPFSIFFQPFSISHRHLSLHRERDAVTFSDTKTAKGFAGTKIAEFLSRVRSNRFRFFGGLHNH
ncbi:MAG: hypothetical protein SO133_02300 [Alloprevotella sp.]|nr:hypothetical protein [Alloprevotella sp.]